MSFDFRYSDLNKEKFIFGNSNLFNKPEILYLDYVFEEVSDKIRNFVKKSKLNISVMFLPGKLPCVCLATVDKRNEQYSHFSWHGYRSERQAGAAFKGTLYSHGECRFWCNIVLTQLDKNSR